MRDCEPTPGTNTCRYCGWTYPLDGPFPRRNCPHVPSRGLGDTVAKITRFFGIKPCGGCKKRQAWLNKHFPYAH